MMDRLWQAACVLLLAACATLGYKWWSASDDAADALKLRDTAVLQLSQEQLTVSAQQLALERQTGSITALEKAGKAAKARAAALEQQAKERDKRMASAVAAAGQVDAGKVLSCDAAMPTVRQLLKGLKP